MKDGNFLCKLINSLVYLVAWLLIFGAIAVLIWLARPYITLLVKHNQVTALEEKVAASDISGNRIIIPSVLIDAPILEGISAKKLSKGIVHVEGSAYPGSKGNCIMEGHNLAEFGLRQPQNFFSLLDIVRPGTKVYVFWNGKKHTYEVSSRDIRDVKDASLYSESKSEKLTLITCVSTWSLTIYTSKRAVVTCKPLF